MTPTLTDMVTLALVQHLFAVSLLTDLAAGAASCGSNEYCPAGWSVKRRAEDYSAVTCEPTAREGAKGKCPKPYMCVAAKCGINFCCVNDKMLSKMKAHEESVAENVADDSDDDGPNESGAEDGTVEDVNSANKKPGEL